MHCFLISDKPLVVLQVKLLAGASTGDQFGRDVIPHALEKGYTVIAHHFDGYWRVSPARKHAANVVMS